MIEANSIVLTNDKVTMFQHPLCPVCQGDDYRIRKKNSILKRCNEIIAEIRVGNCKRANFFISHKLRYPGRTAVLIRKVFKDYLFYLLLWSG